MLWHLERPAWEDCSAAASTEVGKAGRRMWVGKKSVCGCHSSQVALLGVSGWTPRECRGGTLVSVLTGECVLTEGEDRNMGTDRVRDCGELELSCQGMVAG